MEIVQKFLNFVSRDQVMFQLGNFVFLYYGLIIAVAMFFSYAVSTLLLQIVGVDVEIIKLSIIFTIPSIAVFSRTFPLILNFKRFLRNPKATFRAKWFTYLGGFYGLFLSWILLGYFFDFLDKGLIISDALMLFLPLSHVLGRFACVNYGCCTGKIQEKKNGLYFSYKGIMARAVEQFGLKEIRVCPVHFYEMILNFGLAIILLLIFLWVDTHGWIAGTYMIGYALIRLFLEPYRGSKKILMSKYSLYSVWMTVTFFLFGAGYYYFAWAWGNPVIVSFNVEYLWISLSLLPLVFGMSVLAFFMFGTRRVISGSFPGNSCTV